MDYTLLGFKVVGQMFNAHPVFVHFPIALIPASLLLYFLGVVLKNRSLLVGGRACLYMALAGAAVAVGTGLIAEDSFPHNETIHVLMQTHKAVALVFLGLTGLLSLWSFFHNDQKPKSSWTFLAGLGAALVLAGLVSDLGGRMVYVEGAAVKPAVEVISRGEADEVYEAREEKGHEHHHQYGESHEHEK